LKRLLADRDQPEPVGLLHRHRLAPHHQLERAGAADQPREALRPAGSRQDPERHLRQPDLAAPGGPDPEVAGQRAPAPPADLILRGDPERVRQIVLNLVSNAVKFTDAGGTIDIETEGDAERVRIHVRDTGRGIPADKLEVIFDPFVQLDRQRSAESQQGVGLGLAISRDLALAMGGELVARSVEGVGSDFVLALPRWESAAVAG
jgi:signal transduction histidine kinase